MVICDTSFERTFNPIYVQAYIPSFDIPDFIIKKCQFETLKTKQKKEETLKKMFRMASIHIYTIVKSLS